MSETTRYRAVYRLWERSRRALPLTMSMLAFSVMSLVIATPAQAHPEATSEIVDSTRGDGKVVALTFDDGPNPPYTRELLQVLDSYDVTATFCLWGEHVVAHPQLVREVVKAGHLLCNHTMRHEDLGTWSKAQIRANIQQTNAAIHHAAPGEPITYFRAPYGNWGQSPEVAAQLGLQPLGWRLDVGDWNTPGTDVLVQRLLDGVTPGAVVLLHDGGGDRSQTVEAVKRIIPKLKAEGWSFGLPAAPGAAAHAG